MRGALLAFLGSVALGALPVASAVQPKVEDATVLAPGAPVELGPDEGHVLLVFDLLDEIDNVRFTPEGGRFAAFAVHDLTPGIHPFLLRLPAGTYCLANFKSGKLRWSRKDKDKTKSGLCFGVVPGALNYSGHLFVRGAIGGGLTGWRFDINQFLARMARDYPEVLAAHTKLRATGTSDGKGPVFRTLDFGEAAFQAGDSELGASLLQRSADAGDTDAMVALGLRFFDGNGLREDSAKALGWFVRAEQAGEPRAAKLACLAAKTLDPPDSAAIQEHCVAATGD